MENYASPDSLTTSIFFRGWLFIISHNLFLWFLLVRLGVKCCWIFLELNCNGLFLSLEEEKGKSLTSSCSFTQCEIRKFQIAVVIVQRRQQNEGKLCCTCKLLFCLISKWMLQKRRTGSGERAKRTKKWKMGTKPNLDRSSISNFICNSLLHFNFLFSHPRARFLIRTPRF